MLASRYDSRQEGARLFEVPIIGGLYTYILAFPDASYIRTPLRTRAKI